MYPPKTSFPSSWYKPDTIILIIITVIIINLSLLLLIIIANTNNTINYRFKFSAFYLKFIIGWHKVWFINCEATTLFFLVPNLGEKQRMRKSTTQ